jgi:transcriptional regulator with XRE-family HTH domain
VKDSACALRQIILHLSMTNTEFYARRKALGMGMVEIGNLLGRTRAAIWLWETGKSPIPSWVEISLAAIEKERQL